MARVLKLDLVPGSVICPIPHRNSLQATHKYTEKVLRHQLAQCKQDKHTVPCYLTQYRRQKPVPLMGTAQFAYKDEGEHRGPPILE